MTAAEIFSPALLPGLPEMVVKWVKVPVDSWFYGWPPGGSLANLMKRMEKSYY